MADKEKENTVLVFPTKEKRKPSSTEMIWGKDIVRHGYIAVLNILDHPVSTKTISPPARLTPFRTSLRRSRCVQRK
jgi:hypothetical protein